MPRGVLRGCHVGWRCQTFVLEYRSLPLRHQGNSRCRFLDPGYYVTGNGQKEDLVMMGYFRENVERGCLPTAVLAFLEELGL